MSLMKPTCPGISNSFLICSISCIKAMETYCPRFELPISRYPFLSKRDRSMFVLTNGIQELHRFVAFYIKYKIKLET